MECNKDSVAENFLLKFRNFFAQNSKTIQKKSFKVFLSKVPYRLLESSFYQPVEKLQPNFRKFSFKER